MLHTVVLAEFTYRITLSGESKLRRCWPDIAGAVQPIRLFGAVPTSILNVRMITAVINRSAWGFL